MPETQSSCRQRHIWLLVAVQHYKIDSQLKKHNLIPTQTFAIIFAGKSLHSFGNPIKFLWERISPHTTEKPVFLLHLSHT